MAFPMPSRSHYADLEEWEAHGGWEIMSERNRSSSLLRATPPFSCIHCRSNLTSGTLHDLQQLIIRGADRLRGLRNILFVLISPLLPIANRALPAGSEDVRDNTSSSSSSLSSAADGHEIFIPPTAWSASSICDPHDLSLLAASAAAGPEPRGADDCPNSLEKKGHTRSELSQREKPHNARTPFPQEQSARALRPNTYRTDRVCHLASENADTDRHTS